MTQDNDTNTEASHDVAAGQGVAAPANEASPSPGAVEAGGAEGQASDPQTPAKRIAELEAEVAKLKGDYLRALAEAQNASTRADRRIENNTKYAIANFAKDLVTVADNLQRALQHVSPEARSQNELLDGLATGVEMTERSLLEILERNGLTRIPSLQQPFDPHLHQAVHEVEDPSVPAGTILQVFQEGYSLRDRLVRPAMVAVSRGGPKRQAAAPSPTLEPAPEGWSASGGGDAASGHRIDTEA
ncbi:MAG: nucleotide exchange factor GrpE [Alphaproteobacteria bacterium]